MFVGNTLNIDIFNFKHINKFKHLCKNSYNQILSFYFILFYYLCIMNECLCTHFWVKRVD